MAKPMFNHREGNGYLNIYLRIPVKYETIIWFVCLPFEWRNYHDLFDAFHMDELRISR